MNTKLETLRRTIAELESAVVCFSGGVDSTFLLRVVHDVLGDRCIALTAVSPAVPFHEVEEARTLANAIGASHVILESHELDRPDFVRNSPDRCYHCKQELMSLAWPLARERGLKHVCLGTNVDDLSDHRPGKRASDEHAARHPLLEAQLGKEEIRQLSHALGLPTWDKPQMACLSSRIPYGTTVTPERLRRIEGLETSLRRMGFSQVRVRHHDTIARIELDPVELARALDMRATILQAGREVGFTYVTLDLAGYRTGAMNEVLRSATHQSEQLDRRGIHEGNL